jgi:hypothetical protein
MRIICLLWRIPTRAAPSIPPIYDYNIYFLYWYSPQLRHQCQSHRTKFSHFVHFLHFFPLSISLDNSFFGKFTLGWWFTNSGLLLRSLIGCWHQGHFSLTRIFLWIGVEHAALSTEQSPHLLYKNTPPAFLTFHYLSGFLPLISIGQLPSIMILDTCCNYKN